MRGQDRRRLSLPGAALVCLAAFAIDAAAQDMTAVTIVPRLTGRAAPMSQASAPPLGRPIIDDQRSARNFPQQPPIIPHSIDGYQLTLNTNRCLSCHEPKFAQASGAPMISLTHFTDRDGQTLSDVAPRRYFCLTCHVQQTDVTALVPNSFRYSTDAGAKR